MSRSGALRIVLIMILFQQQEARAQFSPGELSRPHMQLEGVENCTQCHEVGKQISGAKCLPCHVEIKRVIDSGHGYHFSVSSKKCISCHKEHLGRDVRTVLFDKETFEHNTTGYALTGKHATTSCEKCHRTESIKSQEVTALIAKSKRETYLGLDVTCLSCHEDSHRGTLDTQCQSCHSTTSWSPAPSFDHSRTKFALTGKHVPVECAKCHTGIVGSGSDRTVLLTTKSFTDCKPCHSSPHARKLEKNFCNDCHVAEGWSVARGNTFDHDLTSFELVGEHRKVQCDGCHKVGPRKVLKPRHAKCIDCHTDYHRGEFKLKFANDCERCHTPDSFRTTTFALAAHEQTRFPLTGAHAAEHCNTCHARASDGRRIFHFSSLECESCHRDVHVGQFAKQGVTDCAPCHATQGWRSLLFEHDSQSSFALTGAHKRVECKSCHHEEKIGERQFIRYKPLSTRCESCHEQGSLGNG